MFRACSRDRVFTRTSLAITGIIAVIFGIAAGYGLTMAIGLPFTSLQQVQTLNPTRDICYMPGAPGTHRPLRA
jgi:hypothetical protein